MNCREFSEFLIDYFDGTLDGDVVAVFEQHLERCPPCKDYLRAYQLTVQLGCSIGQCSNEIPADVPDRLVQAILASRRGGQNQA